jgi:hypothetical protein
MARQKEPPRYDMELPREDVSFDVEAFDSLIRSHGVVLEHYAATLCPIGIQDMDDMRTHLNHSECSNGFIYDKIGEVEGWINSNGSSPQWEAYGIQDGSSVTLTLPRFYDQRFDGHACECPIMVQHYDRFYLRDIQVTVVNSQRFEHNQTGIDRMAYPVVAVQSLIDSSGKRYHEGVDFDVIDGLIKWKPMKSPGYDPGGGLDGTGTGVVCSIRYSYRPYYYVERLLHEVRVSKDTNPYTGEVTLVRMPYQILLRREWSFENEERVARDKPSDRDVPAPRSGGFGPR